MNRKLKFYTLLILFTGGILWCMSCYAQEQDIAESFGLYSKGMEYYHAGKLYEARDILERAVSLDPRNDEAQGYLDLVNAELNARKKGKFNAYQGAEEPERETDLEKDREEEVYEEIGGYEPDIMEEDEYGSNNPEEVQGPSYFENEDEQVTAGDESGEEEDTDAKHVSGEYRMSLGATSEDLIWKEANGDYNERNFRMIDHDFPKTNTFDTRVYDRFKVVFDTNKKEQGFNFHSDITVDPWSFVGKTDKFTVTDGADSAELELKYWSGTNSTINEKFYTSDYGRLVNAGEYKVTDGKIPSFIIHSEEFSTTFSNFVVPEQKIDFMFQPMRELWFDYANSDYKFRVFPFGLGNQALSSDDPLGLSNHHIYWEPSPWLDDWVPGHANAGRIPEDFSRGEWSDDLSFFTRDSDMKRLTALRGVSFQGDILENTNISATVATPKSLWQDYSEITALPGAIRVKTRINDGLMIGAIDTFRMGYKDGNADSYNNVVGMDISCDPDPSTNIVAEVAASESEYDKESSYETKKNGSSGHVALKKDTGIGSARIAFTHMDKSFDAGLTSYKETRKDQFWGRHIHFKEPLESTEWGEGKLQYYDVEPFRIGDGIDAGRNVINFRLDKKGAFEEKMDNLIDYRYVRDTDHKYVEGVLREENTLRINQEWTSKLLFLYHDLPNTKGGIDPIYYDPDTGEYLINADIDDKKDPSLSTYSGGLQYAPEEWISFFGVYENTNDFTFATGNNPRWLLNDTSFATETIDGKVYRKKTPYLYSQGFFGEPPYERFNIYRTGISLKPAPGLGIDLDYTKNDFKFAQGIDDNLNHLGAAVKYKFTPKLTGFLKYTFSKAYNLYRLNTSGDLKYQNHHNVFMEFDYAVNEDGLFVIEFGEGSVPSGMWGFTQSPFGDFYPTLDTQHIVRVYYNGRF